MKKTDVLAQAREIRPGEYPDDLLLSMVEELEGRILREVLKNRYPDYEDTPRSAQDTTAPAPYDAMYKWYIAAQIDLFNGETDRYNADLILFNQLYDAYRNYTNSTYAPKIKRNYNL